MMNIYLCKSCSVQTTIDKDSKLPKICSCGGELVLVGNEVLKEIVNILSTKNISLEACKCGDYPRVKTNGGNYVHLYCKTCNYESMPFLGNSIVDVIETWNKSNRDRNKQIKGSKEFDILYT